MPGARDETDRFRKEQVFLLLSNYDGPRGYSYGQRNSTILKYDWFMENPTQNE